MSTSGNVRVFCPNCRSEVRVPPENMGEMGVCKHCKQPFRPRAYVRLACPGCQSSLDIRKEYMGRTVSCKHCGQGFVAQAPGTSSDLAAMLPGETPVTLGVAKSTPRKDDSGEADARQLKVAQGESTRLRDVLESVQVWKRRAETAEQERDSTRAEREVLQLRLGQIEALNAEHEAAIHEVYEATNAECVALLAEVETERQAREQVEAARRELEADLEAMRTKSISIRTDLDEARRRLAESDFGLPEVGQDRQSEIDKLSRDLALAREREESERHARERLEAARAELESDLEALRSESDGFRADLVEARRCLTESASLGSEADPAKLAEIEQLTRDLAHAREREESERQAKERLETARAELVADLEILHRENDGFRNLVEARQHLAETDLLRPEGDRERQAEIEQLTRDLAHARERENTERQAKERLEAARAGLEADLQAIRRQGEGFRRDLVEAWQRLAETDSRLAEIDPETQAKIEQLTRDLDTTRERENSEREAREGLESTRAGLEAELAEAQRRLAESDSKRPEVDSQAQAEIDKLSRELALAVERENSEREARGRLETARAGLEADLEAIRREGEGIRAELVEAQRRLAESDSRSPEVDRQRQEEIDKLSHELVVARERVESERQERERLESARAALESDLEAHRRDGESIRVDLVETQRRLAEADARRPEFDQLTQDLALAQQREEKVNRQVSTLARRVQSLEGELEREKADRDKGRTDEANGRLQTLEAELTREKADREREGAQYKRILAHLEKEVEAAGARTAKSGKSDTLDRLRAATERGDRLEFELQTARNRLTAVSRDLALAQLYDDDASEDRSAPAKPSEELSAAQLRIGQLNEELKRANQANQKLKDTLDGIGIRFT